MLLLLLLLLLLMELPLLVLQHGHAFGHLCPHRGGCAFGIAALLRRRGPSCAHWDGCVCARAAPQVQNRPK